VSKYKTMAEVDALPTELLIDAPPIPRGDVVGLFGDGSVGKGRLCMSFIREVTDQGSTAVVVLPEDHANEQVRPRIDAAGANPELVVNLTRLPGGARFKLSATERNDGHLGLLREAVEDLKDDGHDPKLLVIDPISAVVGWGSIGTNPGARRVVEGLQDLCADTGMSCCLVMHTVKSGALQGSAGLSQALRLLYRVGKDPADPLVRVISAQKSNNLLTEDLRFVIEDHGAGPRVVWLDAAEIERRQRSWRQPAGASAAILDTLRMGLPMTAQELADTTGVALPVVKTLLWRMGRRGQVISDMHGRWSLAGLTARPA
jgi:hypothetical protein